MKKFENILICTDLDGTLLGSNHKISEKNLEAIEYFKSEGGLFTIVTGRLPYFAEDIYKTVNPNCPFGCTNGGGLFDHIKNEYVWSLETPESVFELVEHIDKKLPEVSIQVATFDTVYFCKENPAMITFRERTGCPHITCHYRDIKVPVAKILFGHDCEDMINEVERLLKSHPKAHEFGFIHSEKTLYEVLPKGVNKGTVFSKLVDFLNIDINKTIAVGDYYNDISMLKTAGTGIAVSNACEEAKKAADYITVSNDENAIAAIISDIDSGKLKI